MDNVLIVIVLIVIGIIYIQNNPQAKEKPLYRRLHTFISRCGAAFSELMSDKSVDTAGAV